MGLAIIQVDAFTDTPFAGNPAAVCIVPAPREERWMQDVAREMNLSEVEVDSEDTVRRLARDRVILGGQAVTVLRGELV